MAVVLDTCILTSCYASHRADHSRALQLVQLLKERDEEVLVPAHAFVEFASAMMCERKKVLGGAPVQMGALPDGILPCRMSIIPIDHAFLFQYVMVPMLAGQIIDTSGGDMIFVAVARGHGVPLITEDAKMVKAARAAGVNAMTIDEFLAKLPTVKPRGQEDR